MTDGVDDLGASAVDAEVDAEERNEEPDGDGRRIVLQWGDGREETVAARTDETVLAAAERRGVALPFGCRTGACATCAGRLLRGKAVHRRPPRALKPRHLDADYVLLCVAEPRTNCRFAVGSDVAGELVSNPWK